MTFSQLPKAKRVYLAKQRKIYNYKLIKKLHGDKNWNIGFMCKELNISRSAYYKWLNKKTLDKDIEDERITNKIKEISNSNNSLFGVMKMYYVLKNEYGFTCGHNRVYRLMCINNIKSNFRRKAKYNYIKSASEETAENILNRNFNAAGPNEKWVTDITEIKVPATSIKLYISCILDLYDRYPVALVVSDKNDTILVNNVIDKAHNEYPTATPLFHSDREFQYTRYVFKNKLISYGMTQSVSRVSKCIDNGPCEQFQGLFKDISFTLYPNITSKDEMIEAVNNTLNYYINEYPQERFKGKTCGEVRKEALKSNNPINYPIKPNKRIIKYWEDIKTKHQKQIGEILSTYN